MVPRTLATASGTEPSPRARSLALLAMCFIFCAPRTFALDPHQHLDQLYHTSWTEKDGVTGNVVALAQTTDGYLWLGTSDGLLRFDGILFERFRPENGTLPATSVSTLMAVPDGGLWVGFLRGGASFVQKGRVTNYTASENFPVNTVRCFARDPSGYIWAAAIGGLARFDGQHWEKISLDWNYPSKTAWRLLVDRIGNLWAATGGEIVFLPKGEKRFHSTGIQLGKSYFLEQAPDGAIFAADYTHRQVIAFLLRSDRTVELLPSSNDDALAGVFDHEGALWLAGFGLFRIPSPGRIHSSELNEVFERFTKAQGLTDDGVESILEDREGNLWVGTHAGLDRFRQRNLTWFSLAGGPFSLVAGSGGEVWAGSRDAQPVVRVQDQKRVAGAPIDTINVYRDHDGSNWYSANSALVHWEHGRFSKVSLPGEVLRVSLSATPPDPIIASAITSDRSGYLWVAFGGSGEFRFKDGTWDFVQILPGHPDWAANFAFTDSRDRVWLSYGDRIACYDRGKILVFGAQEGFAIGPAIVIAGRDEEIFVGGESGLSHFQNGRFQTIHAAGGATFTAVSGIIVVPNRGIWLSTGSGIVYIPQSEVDKVSQYPEHEVAFDLFDMISDLPVALQRPVGMYSSGALQADDGTLWFATSHGAARIDPSHIYRNTVPPPVSIRSVVADDKSYFPFSDVSLPALTKELRIEYSALSLSIPERNRYRYKLQGLDDEWREADRRREAVFTHLGPGNYSFHVIACNNDGVWSQTGATLNFSVAPAWFQTIWFRAFCVGVLGLLVWAIYQSRLQQLHRQFAIGLEAQVRERTRIARELHDTVLQSLHGLLMSFQRAANLLPDRPVEAKQRLESAIDQAAQAITEGREAVQGLRSSTVVTNDLALAIQAVGEELSAKQTTETPPLFNVAVEGTLRDLNPMLRDDVYRIAGEALRNAFHHAQARRIEVDIHYGERELRLRVRDDGKGISTQLLSDKGRPGHWGLEGMRERAKLVGGHLEIWSELDSGTEIELRIPASMAYLKNPASKRERAGGH